MKFQKKLNTRIFMMSDHNLSELLLINFLSSACDDSVRKMNNQFHVLYVYSYRYEIIYSQAITSEDMYLQNTNKSPATASCENMIVCLVSQKRIM